MLEAGFTGSASSTTCTTTATGGPTPISPRWPARSLRRPPTTGIGLTLLPVFYAQAASAARRPPGQRRFLCDLDGLRGCWSQAGAARRCRMRCIGVAPHSLRAVTPDELARGRGLAGNGPIHIHVAEQTQEVDDCLAWTGARPVEWLLDNAAGRCALVPDPRHALTEAETSGMAASGAVAGLCPITEANLGDGMFPARGLLAAGRAFRRRHGFNVLIGAADELRPLEYGSASRDRARNVLAAAGQSTGRPVLRGAVPAARRRSGRRQAALPRVNPPISSRWTRATPRCRGKRDDEISTAGLSRVRPPWIASGSEAESWSPLDGTRTATGSLRALRASCPTLPALESRPTATRRGCIGAGSC